MDVDVWLADRAFEPKAVAEGTINLSKDLVDEPGHQPLTLEAAGIALSMITEFPRRTGDFRPPRGNGETITHLGAGIRRGHHVGAVKGKLELRHPAPEDVLTAS